MNDYLMNITCTGKLEEARAAYFGQPLDPAMLVDYSNVQLRNAGCADSFLRNQNTKKRPFGHILCNQIWGERYGHVGITIQRGPI